MKMPNPVLTLALATLLVASCNREEEIDIEAARIAELEESLEKTEKRTDALRISLDDQHRRTVQLWRSHPPISDTENPSIWAARREGNTYTGSALICWLYGTGSVIEGTAESIEFEGGVAVLRGNYRIQRLEDGKWSSIASDGAGGEIAISGDGSLDSKGRVRASLDLGQGN